MSKVQPRDISPLLQKLRNFLLGRSHISALRFEEFVATRSPPPPCIPDGPSHGIAANYYFGRDARREVEPPTLVASAKAAIESGSAPVEGEKKNLPTPGKVYLWD
ncbi:NADH dehydrogenase (ubiquinone) B14.5 A subunit [Carabus blaptoides fortunei]